MSNLKAISYVDDPQSFLSRLNDASFDLPSPLEFALESRYRQAELGKKFSDLSFCILKNDVASAFIFAHKFDEFVGFNGSGAEVYSQDIDKKMAGFILDELISSARRNNCNIIKIDDLFTLNELSILGQEAFNRKGVPGLLLRASQNLLQDEEALHRGLRQSYKALVNQGRREIDFQFMSHDNANESQFRDFQEFHKQVSGKETRPKESWDVQFEMIKAGTAQLILGYMEPYGLVSSALFTDFGYTTSYAVAVYNRDLFDKPLAHANVYEGMIQAKKREQKVFNLGVIPTYDPAREKEYNIGKFKKGFCRNLLAFIEWNIKV